MVSETMVDIYNNYLKCAKLIPNFVEGTKNEVNDITELSNNYVTADLLQDNSDKQKYFSALMVRYWYMIEYWMETASSLNYTEEDFESILAFSILSALNYRDWLDPNSKVYGDANGPEKCIHTCLYSGSKREYKDSNRFKKLTRRYTTSLDSIISSNNNQLNEDRRNEDEIKIWTQSELNQTALESSEYVARINDKIYCKSLVQDCINDNLVFGALVLDGIMFHINFEDGCFSNANLTRHLISLYKNDDFKKYFLNTYEVEENEYDKVVNHIYDIYSAERRKLWFQIKYFMKKYGKKYKNLCM